MNLLRKLEKYHIGKFLFIFLFVMYIGYFVIGEISLPVETLSQNSYDTFRTFDLEWKVIDGPEAGSIVRLPHVFDMEPGDSVILESILPATNYEGFYLMFWTQVHDFKIYIDDDLRYEYDTARSRVLGSSSPTSYLFTKLHYDDGNKKIRLEAIARDNSAGDIRELYIGEKFALVMNLLVNHQVEFFFSLFLMFLSLLCTVTAFIMQFYLKKPVKLMYLSLGVLISSIWMVTNSPIKQFLIPNISVSRDITFFSVGLLAFPFLIYLNEIQDYHYNLLYRIVELIDFVLLCVATAIYVFGNTPVEDLFSYYGGTCLISIFTLFLTIFIDIAKKRIRPYLFSAIGFLTLCSFAVFEIIFFVTRTGTIFTGSFVIAGMFFLLVFAIIDMIKDVIEISREKDAALMANKAQARFLANMSHEIRTPLNAILGMDEIILREEEDPDIRAYARDIKDAGTSLLKIINDILDYSKIESGRLEIVPNEYNLSDLLTACGNMVRPRIEANDLAFSIDCDPNIPSVLYGDEGRIKQILINLLSNAAKYTKAGSVTMKVEYSVRDDENITLTISVIDTGVGIKDEDKDKLFESFKRLELDKNRSIEGTGLGLAITNELTALMDGTISLQSVYGSGSTFTVNIPQKVLAHTPIGAYYFGTDTHMTTTKADKHILKVVDTKVLVVDDVAVNLRVFSKLLEGTGVNVDSVTSGAKALKMCENTKYDLIFLDHMMPEMDGVETFENLKDERYSVNHSTPVIMVTANAIATAMDEYMVMGFADYVSKPISLTALEEVMIRNLPKEKINL